MSEIRDQTPEDYRHHFDRSSRRAMRKMLIASGLDPDQYPTPEEQWVALSEKIAGGISRTNTAVIGDPFALFVTFRCYNHRVPWEQTLVARSRTDSPIDEDEGKRIIAQFIGSERSLCEQCGTQLTEYTSQMTRMSVFQEQDRQKAAKPALTARQPR